eukprot:3462065-Alexandrium_andersonii.AAC.1
MVCVAHSGLGACRGLNSRPAVGPAAPRPNLRLLPAAQGALRPGPPLSRVRVFSRLPRHPLESRLESHLGRGVQKRACVRACVRECVRACVRAC